MPSGVNPEFPVTARSGGSFSEISPFEKVMACIETKRIMTNLNCHANTLECYESFPPLFAGLAFQK